MFFDRLVIHVDDECPEQYVKITLLKSLALCLFVNVFFHRNVNRKYDLEADIEASIETRGVEVHF